MHVPAPARRLAVGLLAAATAAGGLALLAPAATAAPTSSLTLTTQSAAAGTCTVFTLTALDAARVQATDSDTATVVITENPNSATQDVDFCTVSGTTASPVNGATYTNAGTGVMPPLVTPGSTQRYTPGASITPNPSRPDGAGNPDGADNAAAVAPSQDANSNNPSGADTAQFVYRNGTVSFGVVGLTAGGATLRAFVDRTGGTAGAYDNGEPLAESSATFTEGGLPGSQTVANAAKALDAEPEEDAAQQGTVQTFSAVVTNGSRQPLQGVTPRIRVTSGTNVAAGNQVRADCGPSDNTGKAACAYQGAQIGTDNLTVYVEQATVGGTAGPDASEPQDAVVRSTTVPAVAPRLARFVDLTPDRTSTPSGTGRAFTVKVTSATGAPVNNASLVLRVENVGRFTNGQTVVTVTTNSLGVATATATTAPTETGQQVVTASLFDQASSECGQPAGQGQGATTTTPAGNCSDSSLNTITVAPSASPSASTSPSATPTASASSSPTASPTPTRATPVLSLPQTVITSQQSAVVNATGEPGAVVELFAYSRPSTTYASVRRGIIGEDGTITFRVGPSGNTRMFLRSRDVSGGNQVDSASVVLTVRTSINLKVARVGTRTYRFTGSTLPKRRGQLVTVFYQADGGNRVIASRARVASDGTYNVTRRFSGNGTFTLFTGTGTDINNAANESNRVRTAIR